MVMMMLTKKRKMASDWGTWEELLLGGAVLRHGTGDWTVVSEALRSHSMSGIFTPEICKVKYKDLLERYLGCKSWFEELKKKRVAELKAALLKSEDSIGSLETKLQSLKSESNEEYHQNNDYDSSRTLSVEPPSPKSEGGGECTSKDTSKELSSVGSFTQQELTATNWSPPQAKSEAVKKSLLHGDIFESMYGLGVGGGQMLPSMRKKRGKRKRKDCSASKDVSAVEESDMLLDSCTMDVASNAKSKEAAASTSRGHGLPLPEELMKIYNTISQKECALVFRRRLDSQKRARYKKLVRRHMDLDTIKSRINGRSISSAKELFMDFLLVANNAATFYSKNTREHKSALCLRDIVTKSLRHYLKDDPPYRSSNISTNTKVPVPSSSTKSPSVRTSVAVKRPRTGAHPLKKVEQEDMAKTTTSSGGKKRLVRDSPVAEVKSSAGGKKGMVVERRRGRDGNKQVDRGVDSPALTGRKRNRVR